MARFWVLVLTIARHARTSEPPPDGVVLGAGFAGLAAASYLCERGFAITVVEARSRIGGRVHTEEVGGMQVELGAGWLHGASIAQNSLQRLAGNNGIGTLAGDDDTRATWRLDAQQPTPATRTPMPDEDAWEACAGAFIEHVELRQDEWDVADTLQDQFEEWVKARSMAPDAISGCKALLASDAADLEFGASLEQLGAASYGEGKEPWGGENVVSPSAGGYSALVELLRERIELERSTGPSCSIRTGVAVTGIELGTSAAFPTEKEGGVIVELSNGERLHTAFAINTLPLGVLQQRPPTFRPQLSNQKRRSLHALGVGLLNKVILIYSANFWQGEDAGTRAWLQPVVFADGAEKRSPALPEGVALEYWNGARFGLAGEDGSAAVVLLVGAELAKEWEKDGSNTRIVERADELFRRMFPGAASEGARLVASRVTRWQNETWSRGSYSFLPPGALPSDRTALCAPDGGALFWAGEHCSLDFPATTHGAYDSGIAAALMAERRFPVPGRLGRDGIIALSTILSVCACAALVGMACFVGRRFKQRQAKAGAEEQRTPSVAMGQIGSSTEARPAPPPQNQNVSRGGDASIAREPQPTAAVERARRGRSSALKV